MSTFRNALQNEWVVSHFILLQKVQEFFLLLLATRWSNKTLPVEPAFHIKFNYLLMHTSVSSSVDQILTHHYAERLLFLRLCFRNAKECARKGNTVHQHLGNSIRIYRYFKYHCIAKKKNHWWKRQCFLNPIKVIRWMKAEVWVFTIKNAS